jgi:hypothetical protein
MRVQHDVPVRVREGRVLRLAEVARRGARAVVDRDDERGRGGGVGRLVDVHPDARRVGREAGEGDERRPQRGRCEQRGGAERLEEHGGLSL